MTHRRPALRGARETLSRRGRRRRASTSRSAAGECFGLLGPNGAGKTTTVEILEGLTTPDAGTVELLGQRWGAGSRPRDCASGSASQLQETQLGEKLTVAETVRLFRSFYAQGRDVDAVIDHGRASRRSDAAASASSPAARSSGSPWPARW